MNDYKELISNLRTPANDAPFSWTNAGCEAADAIEVLINDRNASIDALKALIENVDVVPVVRCKDCKHNYEAFPGLICIKGVCVDCVVPENFYCPYGERKGGE